MFAIKNLEAQFFINESAAMAAMIFLIHTALCLRAGVQLIKAGHPAWAAIPFFMLLTAKFTYTN